MGYRQLTQEQRYQISALLVAGKSQRQIAEMLGCHSSTLCRELRRNGITGDYQANQAQQRSDQRRRLAAKAHKRVSSLIDWVSRLIRKRWSPEQIAGLMARMGELRVSRQWIYDLILRDRAKGGKLWTHGRHSRKRRARRKLISDWRWATGKAIPCCTVTSSLASSRWWSVVAVTCWQAGWGDHRRADGQHDHTRADPHSGRRSHPDTGQWQ